MPLLQDDVSRTGRGTAGVLITPALFSQPSPRPPGERENSKTAAGALCHTAVPSPTPSLQKNMMREAAPVRPNGPGEQSPGLRPEADALGGEMTMWCGLQGRETVGPALEGRGWGRPSFELFLRWATTLLSASVCARRNQA
jgi:hypothetical protein